VKPGNKTGYCIHGIIRRCFLKSLRKQTFLEIKNLMGKSKHLIKGQKTKSLPDGAKKRQKDEL
jgi:hypothetical protein